MKNIVILLILKYWNDVLIIDKNREYLYKDLAFKVTNLSTMLDTLKIPNPHIAIIGKNSFHWIVIYITALIKGIPITLINPNYSEVQIQAAINESLANVIFYDDSYPFIRIKKSVNVLATVYYDNWGFDLVYLRRTLIKNVDKKRSKWERLDSIPKNVVDAKTFKTFEDDDVVERQPFITYLYSSGVTTMPQKHAVNERTLMTAARGLVPTLYKNGLKKQTILVRAEFCVFPTVTFLPIMGIGGTINLSKRIGIEEDTNKAVIGSSMWYEEMWKHVAPFMSERNRRWLERWVLTRWLNTIGLRKEFKDNFENVKTFIILNDEVNFRLKDNLKRLDYNVVSTYGTAQHGQLIAINGQVIKDSAIKIDNSNPRKSAGPLLALTKVGEHSHVFSSTGDMASIGSNSELLIAGREDNRIITKSGHTIYPETFERVIKGHELVNNCMIHMSRKGFIVLSINFDLFTLGLEKKSLAQAMNMAEEIKNDINKGLPEEVKINKVAVLRKLYLNEQGKLRRFLYTPYDLEG